MFLKSRICLRNKNPYNKILFSKPYEGFIIFIDYFSLVQFFCFLLQNERYTNMQWWILGEANEAVASGPPFFGGPPSKTAYTVLDSLSGRFGVKTFFFFFFGEHLDFGRKRGKSEMKLK